MIFIDFVDNAIIFKLLREHLFYSNQVLIFYSTLYDDMAVLLNFIITISYRLNMMT